MVRPIRLSEMDHKNCEENIVNHRQRVITALNHEKPDRCPMQISLSPEFAQRLRSELSLDAGDGDNSEGGSQPQDLDILLSSDMLLTSVGWANSYHLSDQAYTDEWGVGWKAQPYSTPFGEGYYTEIAEHPLSDLSAILKYQPPRADRPELFQESHEMIERFKDEYWIVGVTVCTIFETAWALRGFETLLLDMAANHDIAEHILNIPFKYHLAAAKQLVKLGVDMIWLGDDIGAQDRLIISPNMWRKYLKPKMAQFISELKSINKDIKIAYHSDGNIRALIPEFIEIGIDVLNPIQPACMNPAELKQAYGEKLSFWGSIDEQYTLPFGSPADVRNEVTDRIKTIGSDGGLILSPTHSVQLDTPLENFWAMVNTIKNTAY